MSQTPRTAAITIRCPLDLVQLSKNNPPVTYDI